MTQLNAVGHTYRDFLVTKYFPLPELQSTLVELVHQPTGARVMHVAADDPENLFCLSFQTLPTSSNGVAHILEHTVLCGSRKFPVKDPFFAMIRRSLNTFMNAFTGQDFTCYPASSQVEKDFYNLMEVYLDAVFHPQLKKTSFLQEGHRLAFVDSKLQYQGIVYNEMKGAMSCPDSRLWQEVSKHLLPDLPYGYNSGGDPKEIPKLSYEELIEFHESFYHPSRCVFFFYGNLPLEKHLDFIEKQALDGVKKLAPLSPLPLQPRLSFPIRAEAHYPSETIKDKTRIAICWLTAHLSNVSDVLALSLLDTILLENDASPLKMKLLKSGLCKEVDSHADSEMSEVPFMITCNGCDPDNEKKLLNLLFETLRKIAAKPIDPELVEAAMHQLEFNRTEIGGEGGPFGLTLFMRSVLLKQHGVEPEQGLMTHTLFAEMRERLKDPEYLPSIIRKYLIDNHHCVVQIMLPDPELDKKEKFAEEARLQKIEERLTAEEKKNIETQTKELLEYQESIEHQSLECLPKVTLKDIPPHVRDFKLSHTTLPHFDVYHHECFTNQIVYADWNFDLPELAAEDLPLFAMLVELWTDLGCGGKSYEETLGLVQAHTGGIDAHLALHVSSHDPEVMRPVFTFRGKALLRNVEPFFKLLSDFAKGPDLSDHKRIHEWLLQHASELENELVSSAMNYAAQAALSGYSEASYVYNQWNGLPYHDYVQKLVKNPKDLEKLKTLASLVCRGKPDLVLSCGAKEMEQIKKHNFYDIGKWVSLGPSKPWKGNYPLPKPNSIARFIPAPVAYTAMGLRTSAFKDPGVPELMITSQLLSNVVLHKEIREKGGAYGGGASYMPTTGNFHLYAYRDPNLSKSLETFKMAIEKIAAGEFSERELEESKLRLIGSMDTPVVPGGRASVAYAWLRSGRTTKDRQTLREKIVATTKEQVCQTVSQKLLEKETTVVSLLGEELWKKEQNNISEKCCPNLTVFL